MRNAVRGIAAVAVAFWVAGLVGGCPAGGGGGTVIEGGTGGTGTVGGEASVTVLSPASNLSIQGGTPVEVNWRAVATTLFGVVDVFVDVDQNPDNDNELVFFSNLELTETTALVDTTLLAQGVYFVGVRLEEVGEIVAFGYAPGTLTIDQRPQLLFRSPADETLFGARDNVAFDRTQRISVPYEVIWDLEDPDSLNTTFILLDPDEVVNGNEVLLYRSESQSRDSFRFDLPTASFEAGTYRFLALVTDGTNTVAVYSPGSLRLRARLAGAVDLRDLYLSTSRVSGAIFEGFNPRDNAGSFVGSVRDIDRDGFDDFLLMAQFGKSRYEFNIQRAGIGEAYLVYGRADRFSGVIPLNATGTLFRGEIYTGAPEVTDPVRPGRGIKSFTLLSDWDGDGVREMAFGLPFSDSVSIGRFVISTGGLNLAPLDPNGYFRSGAVVVAAGSSLRPDLGFPGRNVFNLAELGTLGHEGNTCGICTLPNACPCLEGFVSPKAPTALGGCPDTKFHRHVVGVGGIPNQGSVRLGCRFSSTGFADQFGEAVSDWDFDAIIMSAPNRSPATSVERALAEGRTTGGVISMYFCDVKSGFYPWASTQAPAANEIYPGAPQSAGLDLLPHGGPYHYIMDDLVFSPGYFVDPDDQENPCEVTIDARIATPDRSVRFWSDVPGGYLSNVTGIGDLNGDGLRDLVIGVPLNERGTGAVYIIFGRLRELLWGGELLIEELGLPMFSSDPDRERIFDGIRIVGTEGSRLGQSQDDAGDFNNDGLNDILIGSPFVLGRRGGAGIFFGSRDAINLTETEIPFEELPARGLGVLFAGEEEGDLAGARVANAGDVDGDGNTDILIAAPNRSVRLDVDLDGIVEIERTECGVVYLIYGSPELARNQSVQDDGTLTEPGILLLRDVGTEVLPGAVFIGRNSGDHLGAGLGEQGDRSNGVAGVGDVDGDGAGDLLLGSVRASPRDRARAGEAYLIYGVSD